MTLATPPSSVLPRAGALTDLLLAPVDSDVAQPDRDIIRGQLQSAIDRLGADAGHRVDGRLVHLAVNGASRPTVEPFEWNARSAARAVGLDGLRSCVRDLRLAAAAAIADSMRDRPADQIARRATSLDRWLDQLPPGAAQAVHAEALTWTTKVRTALDWDRMPAGTEVGGPDLWWNGRPPLRVGLRARAELRAPVPLGPSAGGGISPGQLGLAVLVVIPGWPGPATQAELGVIALAHLVAPAAKWPVVRVVGWWPRSGTALALQVDRTVVARGIDTVTDTLVWAGSSER